MDDININLSYSPVSKCCLDNGLIRLCVLKLKSSIQNDNADDAVTMHRETTTETREWHSQGTYAPPAQTSSVYYTLCSKTFSAKANWVNVITWSPMVSTGSWAAN